MSPSDFTTALQTLGLDTQAASKWLGVSVRAVQRYRVSGAPGPVAGMLKERLQWLRAKRALEDCLLAAKINDTGDAVSHSFAQGVIHTYNAVRDSLALDWRE